MNEFKNIIINKNRGWRGLAEVRITDKDFKIQLKMIFSFSQAVWDDLVVDHAVVIEDETYYYVIHFDETNLVAKGLPKAYQQRSVLIKNFVSGIIKVNKYEKNKLGSISIDLGDQIKLNHFRRNSNNHTNSDWNYIGIRVRPEI